MSAVIGRIPDDAELRVERGTVTIKAVSIDVTEAEDFRKLRERRSVSSECLSSRTCSYLFQHGHRCLVVRVISRKRHPSDDSIVPLARAMLRSQRARRKRVVADQASNVRKLR